jgi:hypothetical protein
VLCGHQFRADRADIRRHRPIRGRGVVTA